jgi:hypothetical protein
VNEPSAPPASAEEIASWSGFEVDELGGASVGRVTGCFVDAENGAPAWLAVALEHRGFLGRRRRGPSVAIPVRECARGAGRVWTALGGIALRSAPAVDPARPLLREHELTIGAHYGIDEGDARPAEIAGRPKGSITATPSS